MSARKLWWSSGVNPDVWIKGLRDQLDESRGTHVFCSTNTFSESSTSAPSGFVYWLSSRLLTDIYSDLLPHGGQMRH